MKFAYASHILQLNDGDFGLIYRPEIPVTLITDRDRISLLGLVDTGSDNTIFPLRLAALLGVAIESHQAPQASAFGGARLELAVGQVTLQVADEAKSIQLRTEVCFFDFKDPAEEMVILGHAGFLEFFTATFSGDEALLTLVPNSEAATAAIAR